MIYILYGIPIVFFLSAVAMESGVYATCGLAALLGLVYIFYGLDPMLWCWTHPAASIAILAGYFLVGFLWALFKYYDWLRGQNDNIVKAMDSWRRRGGEDLIDTSVAGFSKSIYADDWKPSKNKDRILFWMTWWVFSVVWFLSHDLFAKIWRRVYDLVAFQFEWLASRAFRRSK